jgi:hypothetical protein
MEQIKLDAQEKRARAIEILKDKMFELVCDYIVYSTCADDPHIKSCQEKAKRHGITIC